ncbi:hypothetical protein [Nonomuraea diastatica]|uniref:hypothetical protein n=1 Tax=Nonomuraea diastatica TaxID=1848329 RepID=UPI00140AAB61|nr:hypothetical protein [Nonomuraea diastatica]
MSLTVADRVDPVVLTLMVQDRQQVALGEAAHRRRGAQNPVDVGGPVQLRQDGVGNLRPDPADASRHSLDQPGRRPRADRELGMSRIMTKPDARDRVQLVIAACESGLGSASPGRSTRHPVR